MNGSRGYLRVICRRRPLPDRLILIPHGRLAHYYQFLRRGRMHGHGGAHLHRNANELNHLAGALADDVNACDPVGVGIHHELHQHAAVTARQCRLERAERRLVDVDPRQLFPCLAFGKADGADFGLGKYRGWDVRMVHDGGLAAKHRVREGVSLTDRDRREIDPVGNITDRIDGWRRGARISVDRNSAKRRRLDARLLNAKIGNVGPAAHREHDAIGGDCATTCQRSGIAQIVFVFVDRGDELAEDHLDAAHLHFAAHTQAHVVVETTQDVFAAIDERHARSEPGEDAGELDCDVAAALDHDLGGKRRQMKGLIRRDGVLDATNRMAEERRRPGGDKNVIAANARSRSEETNRGFVLDHGARLDDLHTRLLEVGAVGALKPRYLLVHIGDQSRPIESGRRHGPAETRGILEGVWKTRRVDQERLWYATADDAGAADAILLGDHHPRAMAGCDSRGPHTAGT